MNKQLKLEEGPLMRMTEMETKIKSSHLPQVYQEQVFALKESDFLAMAKLTRLIQHGWERFVKTNKITPEIFVSKFYEIHEGRIGKLTEMVVITILIDNDIAKEFLKFKS
jgi:hypothetical protein